MARDAEDEGRACCVASREQLDARAHNFGLFLPHVVWRSLQSRSSPLIRRNARTKGVAVMITRRVRRASAGVKGFACHR